MSDEDSTDIEGFSDLIIGKPTAQSTALLTKLDAVAGESSSDDDPTEPPPAITTTAEADLE